MLREGCLWSYKYILRKDAVDQLGHVGRLAEPAEEKEIDLFGKEREQGNK